MDGKRAAALFRAMADRLERGDPVEFGGAFLLVSPDSDDAAVDGVTWCSAPNPAAFWATVNGRVEMAIESFKGRQSPMGAGRRY